MLLLTGFERFAPFSDNPTQQIVNDFDTKGLPIHKAVLPVDFQQTRSVYEALLEEVQPRFILHLGLNGGANAVHLENFAVNVGYDPNGNQWHPTISDDPQPAYRTRFDTIATARHLCEQGIPCLVSNHAGSYLCNFVYYHALRYTQARGGDALFVHLPFSTELVAGYCLQQGKSYASLPLDYLKTAVEELIYLLLKQPTKIS